MGGSKQDTAASFYVSVTSDLSVAPYQIDDSNKSLTKNTTVLTYHTHVHVPYTFLGRRNHFTKGRILFNSYGFFFLNNLIYIFHLIFLIYLFLFTYTIF